MGFRGNGPAYAAQVLTGASRTYVLAHDALAGPPSENAYQVGAKES